MIDGEISVQSVHRAWDHVDNDAGCAVAISINNNHKEKEEEGTNLIIAIPLNLETIEAR